MKPLMIDEMLNVVVGIEIGVKKWVADVTRMNLTTLFCPLLHSIFVFVGEQADHHQFLFDPVVQWNSRMH